MDEVYGNFFRHSFYNSICHYSNRLNCKDLHGKIALKNVNSAKMRLYQTGNIIKSVFQDEPFKNHPLGYLIIIKGA